MCLFFLSTELLFLIFNPVLPTQFKPQHKAEAFFFIIIYCASLKPALFISIRRKSKNGCSFKTQIKQAPPRAHFAKNNCSTSQCLNRIFLLESAPRRSLNIKYKQRIRYSQSQINLRVLRILDEETENSSSPQSMRRGIIFGSAAASPHIPTGIFALFALLTVISIAFKTAGSLEL